MAILINLASPITDNNLGTIAMTMLDGAVQFDVIMRENRESYLDGKSSINSLDLQDRYLILKVEGTDLTAQEGLGYLPANFIDLSDVGML